MAALEYLLDRLAPDLDAADEDGNTLLAYAALSGNADVVQVLLRAGADTATRRP